MLKSLTLLPQVTLLGNELHRGNQVGNEVIRVRLNVTCVLINRKFGHRHTGKEDIVKTERMPSTSKETCKA